MNNRLTVRFLRHCFGSVFLYRAMVATVAAAGLLLSSCAGQPKQPEPVELKVSLRAADDVNPDRGGRPSPIVVVIFQLKSADKFMNGDFFSIYSADSPLLAGELLSREQVTLLPGEAREFSAEFDPEIAYIGVLAAYRDIENAEWRALAALPAEGLKDKLNLFKKQKLQIAVSKNAVSANIG